MQHADEQPTSFLTLEPGTLVVDRFARKVGDVDRVMLLQGSGFDGIIVRTRAGRRFVDAPEVRRISRGAVVLGITAADVEHPPPDGQRVYGLPQARYDTTELTEAHRDDAIGALKHAYVREELTIDELGARVGVAHLAETLDELDAALTDLSPG